MPTERLSMRKTILRLKWLLDRSHREIARVIGVGVGSPTQVVARAKRTGITCWADVEALSDEELDARMYPPPVLSGELRPEPNPAVIHLELRRTGVTLRLLHEEYLAANPLGAYGYTKFVELYNAWADRLKVTMRQVHKAGEKCFVDYSGKRPSIIDAKTGVRTEVELFVAVMGASNYTYVEATATQRSADWIGSHVRLVEFLGGTPHALVPDQLKSGVVIASRYEPGIQRTYVTVRSAMSATRLDPATPTRLPPGQGRLSEGSRRCEYVPVIRARRTKRSAPLSGRARRRARVPGDRRCGKAPGGDLMRLADWACRTVTALTLEAADAPEDAVVVRGAPAVTLATATDWEQRLRELVDRIGREPEVAAYERSDYKALVTVLDVDDCALVIATRAAASAIDLPAVECAARLVRQLVGPSVVDYDYWRGRSVSLPLGVVDPEVDERCDRAEHRYRRFFAAEARVLASLAELLR